MLSGISLSLPITIRFKGLGKQWLNLTKAAGMKASGMSLSKIAMERASLLGRMAQSTKGTG